jgi:hypothetical protein
MSSSERSYHAVSIRPRGRRCDAVKDIDGERYFPEQAPELPLPDCGHKEGCRCRYQHWSDRRQEDDRRSPFPGIAASLHVATNRRSGRDRRRKS